MEKEPRKTETEVEGCSTERYKVEKNRWWYMEGQKLMEEGLQSGRSGLELDKAALLKKRFQSSTIIL